MNPGDVVLVRLPQVETGPSKLRPAVYLTTLPGPYQDALVCGISTQLQNILPNWDELVQPGEADFVSSGLVQASAIRLSYLRAVASTEIVRSHREDRTDSIVATSAAVIRLSPPLTAKHGGES